MPATRARWRSPAVSACLAAALLAGCASMFPGSLLPGTSITEARSTIGAPTAEFPSKDGGHRLEYGRGKQTYMLDFDAEGRLVRSDQVLDDAHFAAITVGMSNDEVRRRLGRPVQVFSVARPEPAQVWNYRYFEGDCVWFQVSIGNTGTVIDAAHGADPACDGPSREHGAAN